jgi:hypothetical protein
MRLHEVRMRLSYRERIREFVLGGGGGDIDP